MRLLTILIAALFVPTVSAQEVEWIRQFGAPNIEEVSGVAVDASGVYVVGATTGYLEGEAPWHTVFPGGRSDGFVRMYDLNGVEVWTDQFGQLLDEGVNAVAVGASGISSGA